MYFTTNQAYRRVKMVTDAINIVATIAIVLSFITCVFWGDMRGRLLAFIFLMGAVVDIATAVKKLINRKSLAGSVLVGAAVVLLVLAAFSWQVAMQAF